jgi:hypothetical protein
MTVKHLIRELQKCNKDAIVVMETNGSWTNIEVVHINNKDLVELQEQNDYREEDDAFCEDDFYEDDFDE